MSEKCQHDLTKPQPTLKPQYPHEGKNGWAMRYWCPVCACWFDEPLATAQAMTPDNPAKRTGYGRGKE